MTRNLQDLIADRIGARTFSRINPISASVGTAEGRILEQHPGRVSFLVVNLSTAEVYICPGTGVSATRGIRLSPSGGSASFNYREDFDIVGWEWTALATAAASDILVLDQIVAGGS